MSESESATNWRVIMYGEAPKLKAFALDFWQFKGLKEILLDISMIKPLNYWKDQSPKWKATSSSGLAVSSFQFEVLLSEIHRYFHIKYTSDMHRYFLIKDTSNIHRYFHVKYTSDMHRGIFISSILRTCTGIFMSCILWTCTEVVFMSSIFKYT